MIQLNELSKCCKPQIFTHFLGASPSTSILKGFLYLKAQNSSWSMERVLCFRDQVFPLLFPIHTSKPASARMKPRLLLGRLEIQLLASPRRPCCSSTTGLDPADKANSNCHEKISVLAFSTNKDLHAREICVQIFLLLLASWIFLVDFLMLFLCFRFFTTRK